MFRRSLAMIVPAFALMAALGLPAAAQDPSLGPPQATPLAEPPAVPAGDGTGVRLTTDKGDIVIGLFNESSPVAAENFLNLVNAGFYDGLTFHRLVPGFVIQGGDPNGDGSGGPGYTIEDEPVVGRYGRGTVAMARTPEPNSQGSQFFVVLDDAAEGALAAANTYAIFGRVVEGMDVVDAIAAMPNSGEPDNAALEPVTITKATVEQVTLPPEPSREPQPVAGDPELYAMLPTTIGGEAFVGQSSNGAEIRSQIPADDPFLGELEGVMATMGATIEDLSFAQGSAGTQDGGASISAFRVAGVDGATVREQLVPFILNMEDPQVGTTQLGGKDVTTITEGSDTAGTDRIYVWVAGDVAFLVQGQEPFLSDAISQLP
jgi:peptidyl-prolyl cis-trans isomerase B (cyclophilin B)